MFFDAPGPPGHGNIEKTKENEGSGSLPTFLPDTLCRPSLLTFFPLTLPDPPYLTLPSSLPPFCLDYPPLSLSTSLIPNTSWIPCTLPPYLPLPTSLSPFPPAYVPPYPPTSQIQLTSWIRSTLPPYLPPPIHTCLPTYLPDPIYLFINICA